MRVLHPWQIPVCNRAWHMTSLYVADEMWCRQLAAIESDPDRREFFLEEAQRLASIADEEARPLRYHPSYIRRHTR